MSLPGLVGKLVWWYAVTERVETWFLSTSVASVVKVVGSISA